VPDWLAVVALGLIEGLTEFLPVSSTGHLLLVENSGWLPRQSDLFNILIQSGTAAAVVVAFAGRIRELAARRHEATTRAYVAKLVLAFAITGVGGLLAKRAGFVLPKEVAPVAWATLIGGVLIFLIEWAVRRRRLGDEVTWTIAVAVGLAQLLAAVLPGTSRSGATILVALALGVARPAATEFSFLLGMPTLLAAGAVEALQALRHGGAAETGWDMIALGTVVAALAALASVKWFLHYVRTHTFVGFGWYRVALGLLILLTGVRHGA
jgi:undecaprenyl-diphosphatase